MSKQSNNRKIRTRLEHYSFGYGDKEGVWKLMLGNDDEGTHYTLLFNDYKRIIDLHKTTTVKGEKKKYDSIVQMRYYTYLRFSVMYSKLRLPLIKNTGYQERCISVNY